ncbi:MAG: hypothetical protein U0Q12_24230 [Vicinamibacterales bacterium]
MTTSSAPSTPDDRDDAPGPWLRRNARVLVVQAIVLAAIWILQLMYGR